MPLAIAEHGSLAFVRALEEKGCKLVRDDQRGRMAFISARNPDPEVFDYFLNHGADPSQGNDFGYTPLILASLNNRTSLIRRYLERGDDASVRDIDGETALSLALEKRNNEAVAALRELHVEEQDYSALTPDAALLKAAADGALGTILNLRDDGISINSADEEGNTPMMLSVKAGHLGVVRSLYHLGADINHRNQKGETPLAIAKASNSTEIVNSLQHQVRQCRSDVGQELSSKEFAQSVAHCQDALTQKREQKLQDLVQVSCLRGTSRSRHHLRSRQRSKRSARDPTVRLEE